MSTLDRIVYKALDRALTGPKNDDPRRGGTSTDRLEYLTDAVVTALLNVPPLPKFSFDVVGPNIPDAMAHHLGWLAAEIKASQVGAAMPLKSMGVDLSFSADMTSEPPRVTGLVLKKVTTG